MKSLPPLRITMLLSILALLLGSQISAPGQDAVPIHLLPAEPAAGLSSFANGAMERLALFPLNPDWDSSWQLDLSSIPDEVLMTDPAQLNPRELLLLDRGLEQKTSSLIERYAGETDEAQRKQLKSQLTDVVSQHFSVRQASRDREIAELEREVASLRARLQQRDDAKLQITQGRVDQLIRSANGLGWDGDRNRKPLSAAPLSVPYVPSAPSVPASY